MIVRILEVVAAVDVACVAGLVLGVWLHCRRPLQDWEIEHDRHDQLLDWMDGR